MWAIPIGYEPEAKITLRAETPQGVETFRYWINRLIDHQHPRLKTLEFTTWEQITTMAKNFTQIDFISYKLTSEEKTHFEGWQDEFGDDVLELLATIVQDDHKVTLSYSGHNDTFIASLICNKVNSDNIHCCMSSYSNNAVQALEVLCYKATVIFAEVGWKAGSQENSWG